MPNDTNDILDQTSIQQTDAGVVYTEIWWHENITGATQRDKFYNTMIRTPEINTETVVGIHPVVMRDKNVKPLGNNKFETKLVYKSSSLPSSSGGQYAPENPEDPPIIETGARRVTARTNQDKDGNLLVIGLPDEFSASDGFETQTGEVDIDRFVFALTLIKRSLTSGEEEAKNAVGQVNSNQFRGEPKRYWYCQNIHSRSDDGGLSWIKRYEFLGDPELWITRLRWQDDEGKFYNPSRSFEIQGEYNFNQLEI